MFQQESAHFSYAIIRTRSDSHSDGEQSTILLRARPAPSLVGLRSLKLIRIAASHSANIVLFAAVAAVAGPGHAQQLSVMSGITKELPTNDDSFAYVVDYSEPLNKIFSYSLVYVNEGHLIDHHRDGLGAQIWAGFNITTNWSIKAGIGPYYYFDTAAQPRRSPSTTMASGSSRALRRIISSASAGARAAREPHPDQEKHRHHFRAGRRRLHV